MSTFSIRVKGILHVPVTSHVDVPVDEFLTRWRAGEWDTVEELQTAIENYAFDQAENRKGSEDKDGNAGEELRLEHVDDCDIADAMEELIPQLDQEDGPYCGEEG